MFGSSLRARFIVPVSLFVVVLVVGGALLFASLESRRMEVELASDTDKRLESVTQVLSVTDSLMMAQTHSLMRLLVQRGEAQGAAGLGAIVQVGDKKVPDLLFGNRAQANNFELVDGVVAIGGGTATLFVKSGEEFVRISTNVKRDNGARAIGTVLDPKGKAIAAIREGKAFYGVVDILGSPYITGYAPIRDARGETVGIWYVGYKADLSAVKETVEKARLLQSGFVAIVDGKGAVRFRSGHVSDEQVLANIKDSGNWRVTKREFSPWGFSALAAYPIVEANAVSRERMVSIIVAGVFACVILIGMMSLLLQRLVLAPLGGEPGAAAEAASRIASGDLASEVAIRPGDSESMMAAIARMRASLRGIVAAIHDGSTALNTAADNLVAMSDRVSDGVGQQNDATASIAATLEEITVSIRHVADSAHLANELACTAGQLSDDGSRSVGEAVEAMRLSAESVNQSAIVIDRLGEASRKITAIVNVIKEIADQTNLLALNAAIEAARAGEAGRGFAVVADEVRKLAERTALSTQEITAMIGDIQSSTNLAITGIEDGAQRVNGSVDRATVAGESMRSINESTGRVVNAVGEISLALKEQSAASEIISRNVEQVANMNESNTAAVRTVVDDAHQLQALAAQLKQTVGSFRV